MLQTKRRVYLLIRVGFMEEAKESTLSGYVHIINSQPGEIMLQTVWCICHLDLNISSAFLILLVTQLFCPQSWLKLLSLKTSVIKELKMGQPHFANFPIRNIFASSVFVLPVLGIVSPWLSALFLFLYAFPFFFVATFLPPTSLLSPPYSATNT